MNFRRNKAFSWTIIGLLAVGAIVAISLAVSSNTKSQSDTAQEKVKVFTVIPTVTAHAGVEPVIGKPSGTPPEGLVSKDIITGKGAEALASSTVTAQYVLMSWKTGEVLQSSWSSGPFTAPLSGVIPGWQQGIPGMKVGGRRLLVIPPSLAYGANGGGPVGPNETLVFVVDLLGVK